MKFASPLCIICGIQHKEMCLIHFETEEENKLQKQLWDICNINVVQGSICRQVEKKLKALDEIIGELREQCRATVDTVYPKKYAHGFCFAVLCCGYTLTDFPISIRLTSLALWQSNDCPSASKATLMNMDKYFM